MIKTLDYSYNDFIIKHADFYNLYFDIRDILSSIGFCKIITSRENLKDILYEDYNYEGIYYIFYLIIHSIFNVDIKTTEIKVLLIC